ncbi:hypothetical protein Y919_03095 [Caloranaerobacter azorensis H53214]|uniref:Uncharacterized protein n=2 Tax=Caloranaerobacter azorensis TaxID=116090 RepID=A0A096BJD2_9FIRM|nr:hypothetical protein [Caloranaerobacter azorensis]KGG80972.1 hypothetical protein Y919_03095 [Caloranaerobacter azorensis H53214]
MMKRNITVLVVILIILTTVIFIGNHKHKENETFGKLVPNKYDNEKIVSDISSDFKTNNISIFDTTYEQLIKIMGKPMNVTCIQDENVITNYGYFSILSYEGVEFIINSDDGFNLANGIVVEIDIVNSNVSTTRGITINDTKEKVKNTYSVEEFYPLGNKNEYPINPIRIKSFIRGKSEIKIDEYDEYCYIQSKDKPIALIFLFKDNIVKRIMLRHLTAG